MTDTFPSGTYKSIKAICKVCKNTIILKIADDYDSDVLKIVPLATCNDCYDILDQIRNCRNKIASWCNKLILFQGSKSEKAKTLRQTALEALHGLTREYAGLHTTQQHFQVVLWDPEFSNIIMDRPTQWAQALNVYKSQAKNHNRDSHLAPTMDQK